MKLVQTIHDALQDTSTTMKRAFCCYVIRDGETVFYVGKSTCPPERLRGHLGQYRQGDTSPVGRLILENKPESDNWQFEMYTLRDCKSFVVQARELWRVDIPGMYPNLNARYDVDEAEQSLIKILTPCLNRSHNFTPAQLPDRYTNHNHVESSTFLITATK